MNCAEYGGDDGKSNFKKEVYKKTKHLVLYPKFKNIKYASISLLYVKSANSQNIMVDKNLLLLVGTNSLPVSLIIIWEIYICHVFLWGTKSQNHTGFHIELSKIFQTKFSSFRESKSFILVGIFKYYLCVPCKLYNVFIIDWNI